MSDEDIFGELPDEGGDDWDPGTDEDADADDEDVEE